MRNKTVKKMLALTVAAVLAGSMAACSQSGGQSEEGAGDAASQEDASDGTQASEDEAQDSASQESASGETYKIGVIQYMPHTALDAANEGFFAALDELGISYEADQQNAAGETSTCQTIAQNLASAGNDLIFAIATPAAQAMAGVTQDIPIVLTAVTDPADAGLVESNDAPGGNVTGTSDLTPVADQIALIKKIFPDAEKVGMLYCSSEANSVFQINLAKEACDSEGLSYEDYTVSSSNEIQSVVESAVGKVDVLYSPTDNIIANNMATVSMIANENQLPVICGEEGMVDNGGLITYGINYYELGHMAGEMAARILTGESQPADMPIEYLDASGCTLKVNADTAEALGLDAAELEAAAQS
ncbi:MAG TPA: ABC transporter substrate-binding protein [Candidatus Pullilachnospira intestinigallinarum]|nr:ABC transporter substrate-binding protein [Candidatus Pullilachnospira intestinigallinarum]